jgi:hypothetical protein
MANREPYKVGDKHYVDKDPDNKWTYVADFTEECELNATTVASCTTIVSRMTILAGPTVEAGMLVKFKVEGPSAPLDDPEDAFVTLRATCANGDQFDKTLYFKPSED